jgi:hypothetical protein
MSLEIAPIKIDERFTPFRGGNVHFRSARGLEIAPQKCRALPPVLVGENRASPVANEPRNHPPTNLQAFPPFYLFEDGNVHFRLQMSPEITPPKSGELFPPVRVGNVHFRSQMSLEIAPTNIDERFPPFGGGNVHLRSARGLEIAPPKMPSTPPCFGGENRAFPLASEPKKRPQQIAEHSPLFWGGDNRAFPVANEPTKTAQTKLASTPPCFGVEKHTCGRQAAKKRPNKIGEQSPLFFA